ncbi:hypothetical protein [Formosa sp. L2A11]|uniref:hypothetical protein n=1 Tax=Formosa sp. L2A11 TaxID=2686363 RepID=UPI0018EEFA2F|nr:hypothetical protein [Formosa sp. L2A11]
MAKKNLTIRQAEYYQGKFDLKNTTKGKRRFLDFFKEKAEERFESPKNYGNWTAAFIHLERCISTNTIKGSISIVGNGLYVNISINLQNKGFCAVKSYKESWGNSKFIPKLDFNAFKI